MPELTPQHPDLLHRLEPWRDAPRWTVGFSGGLDSTVLLHLLRICRDRDYPGTTLRVLHINHGLQAEADDWQRHCEALCAEWGLEISVHRVTVAAGRASLEQSARDARYAVFEQELRRGEPLFLAHHLDDQAETMLLRLLRGSGLRGLAAMAPRRALGQGELVRPLLEFSRAQIEVCAREAALRWVEDASNAELEADRNYLRHKVLPLLADRWPGYRATVGGAAVRLGQAGSLLQQLLPPLQRVRSALGDEGIALSDLLPVDTGPWQLQRWLETLGLPAPDSRQQAEFLRQLRQGDDASSPRLDCGRYVLGRYRDSVYRLPDAGSRDDTAQPELGPGDSLVLPGGATLVLEPATGPGLRLRPGEHLQVAVRAGGERCQPAGRERSQSLKKLLQEAAVPPWWRDRLPLLYLAGELVAVAGLCLCQSSRLADSAGPDEGLWQLRWERN